MLFTFLFILIFLVEILVYHKFCLHLFTIFNEK